MVKKKKQAKQWKQYILVLGFILIGGVSGFLMADYLNSILDGDSGFGSILLHVGLLFLLMYGAFFIQIIIHEAGHLIFGLLTGYKLASFRIGNFIWIRSKQGFKLKRISIAGTGGQCLMVPPDMKDGKIPFVFYNLGGSIINIISSAVFLGIYLFSGVDSYLSIVLLLLTVIGVGFALLNGIPMRFGAVDNDGYNALSLGKSKEALRSFWIQMKIHEQLVKGVPLRDMPSEWFQVPQPKAMKNSMVAVMGVFACNWLMDKHAFIEAQELINQMLKQNTAIVGLHRDLLICDLIYCELVGENPQSDFKVMQDRAFAKFRKAMRNYPTVLRTEYVYALLVEKDSQQALKVLERFQKIQKSYPYPVEIESEQELMVIADRIAKQQIN